MIWLSPVGIILNIFGFALLTLDVIRSQKYSDDLGNFARHVAEMTQTTAQMVLSGAAQTRREVGRLRQYVDARAYLAKASDALAASQPGDDPTEVDNIRAGMSRLEATLDDKQVDAALDALAQKASVAARGLGRSTIGSVLSPSRWLVRIGAAAVFLGLLAQLAGAWPGVVVNVQAPPAAAATAVP